jgi:low affinity Fe/Cu permease
MTQLNARPGEHRDREVVEPDSLKSAKSEARRHEEASPLRKGFQRFAQSSATAVGSPWAFLLAALLVIAWSFSRRLFKDFDTWQLVINTATTIVTFLMVFLIQNTQNRDAKALHLKLDELIRAKKGARNALVDLENCTDEELEEIGREFKRMRERTGHRQPEGDREPS